MKTKVWTKNEIEFIKREYMNYDISDLCKKLDRSKSSVQHKLSRLKLRTFFDFGISKYRKKHLKENCEICGTCGKLEVHHKDGNRYDNNTYNLITVCRSCHMKEDNRIKNLNQYSRQNYSKQIQLKCPRCGRFTKGGKCCGK